VAAKYRLPQSQLSNSKQRKRAGRWLVEQQVRCGWRPHSEGRTSDELACHVGAAPTRSETKNACTLPEKRSARTLVAPARMTTGDTRRARARAGAGRPKSGADWPPCEHERRRPAPATSNRVTETSRAEIANSQSAHSAHSCTVFKSNDRRPPSESPAAIDESELTVRKQLRTLKSRAPVRPNDFIFQSI
jgi:hypothetical protein